MPVAPGAAIELRADCGRCAGLCCVALPFARSADFAIDKPAGTPCLNLTDERRCGVHATLRERGFAGCTVFDCFGAGQHVTQGTFAGRDWSAGPAVAGPMFAAFAVMRQLHELLWYLADALTRPQAQALHDELRAMTAETETLTRRPADDLVALDVNAHRRRVDPLLLGTSARVRAAVGRRTRDHRRADLAGARLAGADLRGADLRGALLIGADLRRADLRLADLIGADLRGTDLRGADVGDALFLTQPQVTAARGDTSTVLPSNLVRPGHWVGAERR